MTVAQLERILTDWFEAPTIVTSCGRSAILLYLTDMGLDRYRDRISMPRITSICVVDAVMRCGFPVDAAERQATEATISYPQYGIPQRKQTFHGRILEDDCHAFFETVDTGSRAWIGEAAAFSLPKFFSMNTTVGAVVTKDAATAQRLRARRDAHPRRDLKGKEQTALDLAGGHAEGAQILFMTYLDRLLNPRIEDDELGGAPISLDAIKAVGRKRRDILDRYLTAIPEGRLTSDWRHMLSTNLPYICTIPGPPDALNRANNDLQALGVMAGVYRIDIDRCVTAPRYVPALMVPCHDFLPDAVQVEICRVLERL